MQGLKFLEEVDNFLEKVDETFLSEYPRNLENRGYRGHGVMLIINMIIEGKIMECKIN